MMSWKRLVVRSVFLAIVAGVFINVFASRAAASSTCGWGNGQLCQTYCAKPCPDGEQCCDKYYFYYYTATE